MRERIIVESRYRPGGGFTLEENIEFVQRICKYAIEKNLNPFASHLFYPGILDDRNESERNLGIQLGLQATVEYERVWVCLRVGEEASKGVAFALRIHISQGRFVEVWRCTNDAQFLKREQVFNERASSQGRDSV